MVLSHPRRKRFRRKDLGHSTCIRSPFCAGIACQRRAQERVLAFLLNNSPCRSQLRCLALSLTRSSSFWGTRNQVDPQSRQTKIFGKVRTPGFPSLRPLKWIMISAVNSTSFSEPQDLQLIVSPDLSSR